MPARFERWLQRAWSVTQLATRRFVRIDGSQWASSFAFNAFFSLFPLIILFVTLASFFVDRHIAGQAIVSYLEGYVPLDGEMRARVFGAISDVIEAREQAGIVALLSLVWAALQCFTTLVLATNRAWDEQAHSWWRLPLRGMALLGVTAGAVLLGMAAPVLASIGKSWLFPAQELSAAVYALWDGGIRVVIAPSFGDIFYSNSLKNGLLPVVLPADKVEDLLGAVKATPAARVRVDLEAQTVAMAGHASERFDLCPFQKLLLRTGQDELGYTLALEASVKQFESARAAKTPWL